MFTNTQTARRWGLLVWGVITTGIALPSYGASFVPTVRADAADANPGDGICASTNGACTLRAAIEEANALAGPDTITVPAGTYKLKRALGQLTVTSTITIVGGGPSTTRINGNKPYGALAGHRIFDVLSPAVLDVSQLALRRSGPSATCGGAVRTAAGTTTNLTNVDVSRNAAGMGGAGLCNGGTMTLSNVTIVRNRTLNATSGGGLINTGMLTLNAVAMHQNRATLGGAIFSTGTLDAADLTVSRNHGTNGGGIHLSTGTCTIANATISQNFADDTGGAVFGDSTNATLTNVTIRRNSARHGGGIGGLSGVKIVNVILDSNRAPQHPNLPTSCQAPASVSSLGHNIDSGVSCALAGAGDLNSTDPHLGLLLTNGGFTRTHALSPGSPAINAGDAGACPTTDQRGFARVGTCDIGSFEFQ